MPRNKLWHPKTLRDFRLENGHEKAWLFAERIPGLSKQRLSELENNHIYERDAQLLAKYLGKDVDPIHLYISHNLSLALKELAEGWMTPRRADELAADLTRILWSKPMDEIIRISMEDGIARLHAISWAASHRQTPYDQRTQIRHALDDVFRILSVLRNPPVTEEGIDEIGEEIRHIFLKTRSEQEEVIIEFFLQRADAMKHALY